MSFSKNHPSRPEGSSNPKTKSAKQNPQNPPPVAIAPPDQHSESSKGHSKTPFTDPTRNPATAASSSRLQVVAAPPSLPRGSTNSGQQKLATSLYSKFPELISIARNLTEAGRRRRSAAVSHFSGQAVYRPPAAAPKTNAKAPCSVKPVGACNGLQEYHYGGFQKHRMAQYKCSENGYPAGRRTTGFKQPTLMEALKLRASNGKTRILSSFAGARRKWPVWKGVGPMMWAEDLQLREEIQGGD